MASATSSAPRTRERSAAATLEPLLREVDARLPGGFPYGLRFWDGSQIDADPDAPTLLVRDPRAFAYIAREPNQLGLGRAWVAGDLELVGDLEQALTLSEKFRGIELGWRERASALHVAWRAGALQLHAPPIPSAEAQLDGRLHSRRRDRAAVRHHYDVSNRFYRLVLGPSMVYSCAYFASPDDTLDEAQERKLDVICRKLRLREGERLLDIGCGWGSLLIHAASRYGVSATGVTLSQPQAVLARERIAEAGLEDRCEVRVADYREVADGPYDKIASIGMYEHVGAAMLDEYMTRVHRLLRAGGLFLNHGIVRFTPTPWDSHSFIARYVFPDGELHTVGTVTTAIEHAGLEVRDDESLREHYALTLRRWVANLERHRDEAIAEAGREREAVWRLYMTGSALAFDRGEISVHQILAAAPGAPHGLPLVRGPAAVSASRG
jgi:cyclopropane-fatty-acyl-phospholipid synthase